jgi:DNA-directed RNA polymerase specialized sigma24 family protein
LDADSNAGLVDLARVGDENATRMLIKRNNRRLFRVARSVLRDDCEAEDAVQETYLKALPRQASSALERAIDDLPEGCRVVFVLRDVEGLSVEETAGSLGLNLNTVRTRLHRAPRLLRTAIEKRFSATSEDNFPFDGSRCSMMGDRVLGRFLSMAPASNQDEY